MGAKGHVILPGPGGTKDDRRHHDPYPPGGRFEYAIRSREDGSEYATHGEYQEVVPNERVVWTNAEGGGTIVTAEFRDVDGGTELSVTQDAFPDSQTRDGHQTGWNACLDILEQLLRA